MKIVRDIANSIGRTTGLDILNEKYAYGVDSEAGYISAQKIADHWVSTTCGYCSVGCGMSIGVKGNQAVAVRGDEHHPVNRGKLCPKGLAEHHTLAAEGRAVTPLLRKQGKLQPVSWDEAMQTMAAKLGEVQAKYGPQSVGVVSTGQLVTEEFYTLGKLVQLGLGTRNFDGNTTLCMSTAVAGYKRSFGSDGPPGCYEDLEKADVLFLIGANIAENHPILCQRLEANKTGKVIVADPRVTKTAMMADVFLPLKPRSDLALLNGLAHILLINDWIDHSYIAQHTNGFDELRAHLMTYTPETVSRITGLSIDLLEKTARMYAQAKSACIAWTMGVNHSTKGTETVNAINNLALLTGNIGRAGASPFSITGQCNAMGTRESGFSSSLPGYRKFESKEDREELAQLWNISPTRIPTARGYAYPYIIEATVRKEIRALWIIATNPIVSFPNLDVLLQGFRNLDFLVVQDGFHPTPTTELAHLVLPAAIWGEKEGTYTNSERRASKVNRAVNPPGEARTDFDIFLHLARELGCDKELFPGWITVADAFEEWKRVSAGRLCDYSGMTYAEIEKHGGLQWPFPAESQGGPANDPTAARRLYVDGVFQTDDGRARLFCVDWEAFPDQPTEEFPLVLNTGRTVEHWHTRTKTGAVPILNNISPRAWLEMNPRDSEKLRLHPHDRVDVISARGRVRGVELRVTEIIAPGQVFLPFHFAESNANQVTQSAFDPIAREPNYKQCAVRIEKTLDHETRRANRS